jgi:hypothetical protein
MIRLSAVLAHDNHAAFVDRAIELFVNQSCRVDALSILSDLIQLVSQDIRVLQLLKTIT